MALLSRLRRRLAGIPGVVPATLEPRASQGRAEEARIVPAELVEPPLCARSVGSPEPWPGPLAFLDGIQRQEILGYADAMPLIGAEVAAAVRERVGREVRTVREEVSFPLPPEVARVRETARSALALS